MADVDVYVNILERDSAQMNTFLKSVSEHPESFVAPSKTLSSQVLKATKTLFDHGMYCDYYDVVRIVLSPSARDAFQGVSLQFFNPVSSV